MACGSKVEVVIGVFQHSLTLHSVVYISVAISVQLRIPSTSKTGMQTAGYVGSRMTMIARSATGGTSDG